jgi:hypothetical protein
MGPMLNQPQVSDTLAPRDLVHQLGGPSAIATRLGISAQAVSNWYSAGIPKAHHLRLWQMAQAAGLDWRPPGTDGITLAPAAPAPTAAAA